MKAAQWIHREIWWLLLFAFLFILLFRDIANHAAQSLQDEYFKAWVHAPSHQ